jgi:Calcineurin-like phosphoesterase
MKTKLLALSLLLFARGMVVADSGPYSLVLGRPTDISVAVSVLATNGDLQAGIEYGTQTGVYPFLTATNTATNGIPNHITISGLQPARQYYYRLLYQTNGGTAYSAGDEHRFHTQRARGDTFTFDIDADPHYGDYGTGSGGGTVDAVWLQTYTNILADQPDFMVDLGDTFMEEKIYNYYGVSNALTLGFITNDSLAVRQNYFGIPGPSVPIFLVNGNHDPELGWCLSNNVPQQCPAVWGAGSREEYFPCPVAGGFYTGAANVDYYQQRPRDGYYAFEWGDALFVMLDPFWYSYQGVKKSGNPWSWTLGTNQYYWLKATLENSTAKFKFVFAHHLVGGSWDSQARGGLEFSPYFEWGGLNTNGTYGFATNRPGWPMPIRDLLLTNHAQVFFHGHDHLYCKQDYYMAGNTSNVPDFIYQEIPQPSHYPYDSYSYATGTNFGYNYQTGVFYGSAGHLRVTVSPTNTLVEYVRSMSAAYPPKVTGPGITNQMVSYAYSIPAPAVTLAPPVLTGMAWANGQAQFVISGTTGFVHTLQASTNLANWTNVFTTNLAVSPFRWSDPGSSNNPRRFYRVFISQ